MSVTVMVIEDDLTFGALLKTALEREGFRTIVHSQPLAALEELDAHPVDAIVVDKEMPQLTGTELVSRARGRHPGLPIVLMTAFGGPRIGIEARARGANGYLEKPFRISDLVRVLHTLAGR